MGLARFVPWRVEQGLACNGSGETNEMELFQKIIMFPS